MIDDHALDTLLTASRPEVEHDPACTACLRVEAPQRRWPRRAAIAGVAGGAVLAVGAGAAATVGLPFADPAAAVKRTQVTSDGHRCTYSMAVSTGGSPGVTADPAAVAAARAALANVDPESLDISDELAEVVEANKSFVWDGPGPRPDFFYAVDSQPLSEHEALTQAISREVFSEVRAQGLSVRGLMVSSEGRCDDFEPSMAQQP